MKCPKCGSTVVNYSCPLSCPCGYVYEETGIRTTSQEAFIATYGRMQDDPAIKAVCDAYDDGKPSTKEEIKQAMENFLTLARVGDPPQLAGPFTKMTMPMVRAVHKKMLEDESLNTGTGLPVEGEIFG